MSRITIDFGTGDIPIRIQINDKLDESFFKAFKSLTEYLMNGKESYDTDIDQARNDYIDLRKEMDE